MLMLPISCTVRRAASCMASSALLLALAVPVPVFAGYQTWTGTGPRARSIEQIVRDPHNARRFWAASFGAGVYRSIDGGVSWTSERTGFFNTFVRCIAVNPVHSDSVWAGTNDGVYLSADGGTTWTQKLATTRSVRAIAIHPIKRGTVYAGVFGLGVYKSLNAGATWNPTNLGLLNTDVRDLALQPDKPDTILAGTGTGGGLHKSVNGGLTWTQNTDASLYQGAVSAIRYDLTDKQFKTIYIALADRGVAKSTNGGNSWGRINQGLSSFRTNSLAVVDTLRYVSTDDRGVFVTSLTDTMWHPVGVGIPAAFASQGLHVSAFKADTAWVGTDGGGIYRSTNRGATWTQLDGGLLSTFGFAVHVSPVSHRVYDATGFGDQLWWSDDSGANWTKTSYLSNHSSERDIAFDPFDANRMYVAVYGVGVFRSDDGGVTFFQPDSGQAGLVNKNVRPVIALHDAPGHLLVGTGSGVYESFDFGASWGPTGAMPPSTSIRSLDEATDGSGCWYAGTDSAGVYRSTNHGASWTNPNTGLGSLFVRSLLVDSSNGTTVFAGTDSGVYQSADHGVTWSATATGLPLSGSVRSIAQDSAHPSQFFCALFGVGVFRSTNRGSTWEALFSQSGLASTNVYSLAVDGPLNTLYAGSDAGVQALSGFPVTAGVADGPAVVSLAMAISPNPARAGDATIRFTLPRGGPVSLAIYDVNGRCVRGLLRGAQPAGAHELRWDGRTNEGTAVSPGLYFARLSHSGAATTSRLVVPER